MIKRRFDNWNIFKRGFFVDPPAGGEGGAGGGAPAGAEGGGAPAGGEGGGAPAGGAPAGGESPEVKSMREENDRLKKENEDYRGFHDRVSPDVEFDEAGKVRLKQQKAAELSEEEQRQAQVAREQAEGVVRGDKHDREARAEIARAKAGDPLFDENMAEAEKFMKGVPVGQQSKERWAYAYSMAAGGKLEKYNKIAEERGRKIAMEEFARNQSANPPGGESGDGASEGADDFRKIVLSKEQIRAANIQIGSGAIKSLDDYKRNLRALRMA